MSSLLLLLALAAPGLDDLFDPFSAAFPTSGERLKAKQAAFETLLGKRGPGPMIRAMARCEEAAEEVFAHREKAFKRYFKARDRYFDWMEDYRKKYRRKEKRDPVEYPVPEGINKGYLDQLLEYRAANSLVERELEFHRWAAGRLGELAAAADDAFRRDLVGCLRAKSPHQRLRAARLLTRVPGFDSTDAFGKEKHPAVAAALAPGAAALADERGPVRAAAAAVLGGRRERASAEALIARWPKEEGRVRDDLHAALGRLAGTLEADWPAWWKALPPDWAPGPPPPSAPPDPERVPATPSPAGRRLFGVETGSKRLVLCLAASRGWPEVQQEVLRFLGSAPEDLEFGFVAFGAGAERFRKGLARNDAATRASLAKWMEGRDLGGRNDLWTGLDDSFALAAGEGADTLFVLNLDVPTEVGDSPALVSRPRQIALEISYRNDLHAIRIHGYGRSGGGDAYFLQTLARESGGGFVPMPGIPR